MKRTFAIILSLVMLITTVSLPVHAATPDASERDYLLNTACEVFPEYAQKIRGDAATTYTRAALSENELLFTKTRSISNNEQLTYSEYSNGTVLLTSSTYDTVYHTTQNDQQVGSGYTTTNITITATLAGDFDTGVFTLSNVVYTIYPSSYDLINNCGSHRTTEYCRILKDNNNNYEIDYQLQENASSNAYITYNLAFSLEENGRLYGPISAVFTLTVGDNGAGVSFYSPD